GDPGRISLRTLHGYRKGLASAALGAIKGCFALLRMRRWIQRQLLRYEAFPVCGLEVLTLRGPTEYAVTLNQVQLGYEHEACAAILLWHQVPNIPNERRPCDYSLKW